MPNAGATSNFAEFMYCLHVSSIYPHISPIEFFKKADTSETAPLCFINPFMRIGLFYLNSLDRFISYLEDVR